MKRYKKSFRTKKKRSVWKTRYFGIGVLFLLLASGSIYLFLFSSVFEIKGVEVLGCEKTSSEEIKTIIEQSLKRNIFFSDLNSITSNLLSAFPLIGEIRIKRKLPSMVIAEVIEREPVVALRKDKFYFLKTPFSKEVEKEYYLIDKQGVFFEKTGLIPTNVPEIRKQVKKRHIKLGGVIIEKDNIDKVLKITAGLNFPIKEIIIVSDNRIDIVSSRGFIVYFSSKKDLDWQTEQLRILLQEKIPPGKEKNIEYIDLRFDKIYIFPENYSE